MAFLYRNTASGGAGKDFENVQIADTGGTAGSGDRAFDVVSPGFGDGLKWSDYTSGNGTEYGDPRPAYSAAAGGDVGYGGWVLPADEQCALFEWTFYVEGPYARSPDGIMLTTVYGWFARPNAPDQPNQISTVGILSPDRSHLGMTAFLLDATGQRITGTEHALPFDEWLRASLRVELPNVAQTATISTKAGQVVFSASLPSLHPATLAAGIRVPRFYAALYGNAGYAYTDIPPRWHTFDNVVARSCPPAEPEEPEEPEQPSGETQDYDNASLPDAVPAETEIPCPPQYLTQASAAAPTRLRRLGRAAEYRCVVLARGGRTVLYDIPAAALTAATWERRANETGVHTVTVTKRAGRMPAAGLRALGRVRTWAHEAALWRVPEQGPPALCAVGPVTGRLENADAVRLTFKDLTAWWARRVIHNDYDFRGCTDLTAIARHLINDALAPDDPNVLQHAYWIPSGVSVQRSGAAYRLGLDREIADLTGLGLDWTMTGRRLIVSGELARLWPRTARLSREHFLADVEVEEAGDEALTRAFVAGAGTTIGYAGGVDQSMGLLEATRQDDAVADADTARIAARAALAVAYPAPVYVRVPDGATLAPSAPLTVEQLLPGIAVWVDIDGYTQPVGQTQRLTRVAGSWERDGGERIAVALSPYAGAPPDDGSPVGPPAYVEDLESEPDEVLYTIADTDGEASALGAAGDEEQEAADETALPEGPYEGDTGADEAPLPDDGPDTPAPATSTDA